MKYSGTSTILSLPLKNQVGARIIRIVADFECRVIIA